MTGSGRFNIAGTLKIGATGSVALTGPMPGGVFNSAGDLQIAPGGNLALNYAHSLLVLNYGAGANPNANVAKYLQNGYNAGHWDAGGALPNTGVGSITSASAGVSGNVFSIAHADGADGVAVNPSNAQQLLPAGQQEIKYTYAGDANLDGQVNLSDLIILANHFGNTSAQWDQGDSSYDGTVNLTDLILLANNFGDGVGNPAQQQATRAQFQQDLVNVEATNPAFAAAVGAALPEPGGLLLVSIGALWILRRNRITSARQQRN